VSLSATYHRARLTTATWSTLTTLKLCFAVLAICVHLRSIVNMPRGMYGDECSIGINAWLIATTGYDEHGVHLPLFFEAFGEYKNPLYIYLMAFLYRGLGYSVWTTRFTSFFCWLLGSVCFYALAKRIWRDGWVQFYVMVCLAATPWIFSLSRVCFELISLYPLIGLYLYAVRRGFVDNSPGWPAVAGVAIGSCVYAYSTFRLLAALQVVATLLCYARRRNAGQALVFASAAALSAVPFVVYVLQNPNALTGRFSGITYVNNDSLSLLEKASMFAGRYLGYFDWDFLIRTGDDNRRHHSGYCGQLLVATCAMSLLGLFVQRSRLGLWRNRFVCLLVCGLLLGPCAAALTKETHHSLRAFSMAFFAILLSGYGVDWLRQRRLNLWVACVLTAALLHSTAYLKQYFEEYPDATIDAFESYGFQPALARAVSNARSKHGQVWLDASGHGMSVLRAYYVPMIKGVAPPVTLGTRSDMRPGDTLVEAHGPSRDEAVRAGLPLKSRYSLYEAP
jgi:4-amino-4-deoxy-L-arabinose transferase-like glycosyltransferase